MSSRVYGWVTFFSCTAVYGWHTNPLVLVPQYPGSLMLLLESHWIHRSQYNTTGSPKKKLFAARLVPLQPGVCSLPSWAVRSLRVSIIEYQDHDKDLHHLLFDHLEVLDDRHFKSENIVHLISLNHSTCIVSGLTSHSWNSQNSVPHGWTWIRWSDLVVLGQVRRGMSHHIRLRIPSIVWDLNGT